MVRSENLSTVRFFLVTIEFVEEDTHYIFAVPEIGIYTIRNLGNPFNKIVDCVLIGGVIHFDFRIDFNQQIKLEVLFSAFFQRF